MTAGVDRLAIESADGTRIHVSVFPVMEPVAVLLVAHGLQSHSGWMEASGTGHHLAERGILTLAYDRRGSGRSGGERGHTARRRHFLDDLDAVRQLAQRELVGRRAPKAPVHLLGHGFGARLALSHLSERSESAASAILACPTTHPAPGRDYSLLDKMRILTAPAERRFPIPIEERHLVSGGVWLEWIRQDERALRAVTAAFLRASGRLSNQTRQAIGRLRSPLLVLTAEDDVLVDNRAVERAFDSYAGPVRHRRLPGDHCVDFTLAQAAFRAALTGWILGGWAAP